MAISKYRTGPRAARSAPIAPTLQRRTLGRTNLEVSPVGFGAAPIGYQQVDQAQVSALLNALLDAGVNVIDTAASYRESEAMIAAAIGHRRDEFVLVSKCGTALDDQRGKAWSPQLIELTIERSLRRLGTDHLDVMLLHSCDLPTLNDPAILEPLERARSAGKIRFLGYSGDNEAAEFAASHAQFDVLELSINICDQANIERVLPLCREHNVGVIAKRPLANAAWKAQADQPEPYREYVKPYADRFAAMAPELAAAGLLPGSAGSWEEYALRFTLSQQGAHTAIIGTTVLDHARANLAAAARGPLAAPLVERIYAAFDAAEKRGGVSWPALQ